MPTGRKTGGGSRKGIPNKATAAKAAEIAASGLTPLEFMLQVLRDPEQPYALRMDASKGAAPYVHPRLANIELSGNKDKPLSVGVVRFDDVRPAAAQPVASKAVPAQGVADARAGLQADGPAVAQKSR